MYLGKLVELADSYELIAHSIHPYTRSLISDVYKRQGQHREPGEPAAPGR